MSIPDSFFIDTSEEFTHLREAPIVEAVIDFRVPVQSSWEEVSLRTKLEGLLSGYRYKDTRHTVQHTFEVRPGQLPEVHLGDPDVRGIRFRSEQSPNVASFNRNGFTFSQLRPYGGWHQFREEAMRLWAVYRQVASIETVERIGLRYINRIPLQGETVKIEDFIAPHPDPPQGLELPFIGYFQQDTLMVPDYPYALTIIRTIQPSERTRNESAAIILDIDTFTATAVPTVFGLEELDSRLAELRWLKNKAFFGSITSATLMQMKEGTT